MDRVTVPKRLVGTLAVCSLGFVVAACDKIALPETGLKAYSSCVKAGKKDGALSLDAVKAFCTDKWQRDLFLSDDETTGHAGPGSCLPEDDFGPNGNLELPRTCSSFAGTLTNNTNKYVITSITVSVNFKRDKKVQIKTAEHLWIEPGTDGVFEVPLDPPLKRKNFSEPLEDNYNWTITGTKGMEIEY
jgi:hypothetical protein